MRRRLSPEGDQTAGIPAGSGDLRSVDGFVPENVARGVAGADAVVVRTTPLPRETLERADRLRIVSRHGVGTDNVDVAYLSSRKIPMAIAIDSNVGSVAEHTLMMLLALAKDAMAVTGLRDPGISPGVIGGRRRTWRQGRR